MHKIKSLLLLLFWYEMTSAMLIIIVEKKSTSFLYDQRAAEQWARRALIFTSINTHTKCLQCNGRSTCHVSRVMGSIGPARANQSTTMRVARPRLWGTRAGHCWIRICLLDMHRCYRKRSPKIRLPPAQQSSNRNVEITVTLSYHNTVQPVQKKYTNG